MRLEVNKFKSMTIPLNKLLTAYWNYLKIPINFKPFYKLIKKIFKYIFLGIMGLVIYSLVSTILLIGLQVIAIYAKQASVLTGIKDISAWFVFGK